jgi:hypothetical protein
VSTCGRSRPLVEQVDGEQAVDLARSEPTHRLGPLGRRRHTVARQGRPQPDVVERRHDRLAGTGGRDDEVAVPAVHGPLGLEGFQDLGLVGERPHLEPGYRGGRHVHPVDAEARPEPFPVGSVSRVVRHEPGVGPVAVERPRELADQGRSGDCGQPDVPLETVDQGGRREVAAADEGRVEAGVAPYQPGLRVQPRGPGLVAHLHLGPEASYQLVDRALLRRADVGRGDDAERDTPFSQQLEGLLQHAKAVPADERTEQVDAVGRDQLRAQLGVERRLACGVGEQYRGRQRGDRPLEPVHAGSDLPAQGDELLGGVEDALVPHGVVGLRDAVEHLVDQRQAPVWIPFGPQAAGHRLAHVPSEDLRRLGVVDGLAAGGEIHELR